MVDGWLKGTTERRARDQSAISNQKSSMELRMSLLGWCQWLEHTPLATAISESVWLFPFIEGSHILALPLSVGMIVMFDLRLLGLAFQSAPASRVMADIARWSKSGFAIMFTTG